MSFFERQPGGGRIPNAHKRFDAWLAEHLVPGRQAINVVVVIDGNDGHVGFETYGSPSAETLRELLRKLAQWAEQESKKVLP